MAYSFEATISPCLLAVLALHAPVPWPQPLSLLLLQLPPDTDDSPNSASRGQGGSLGSDRNVLQFDFSFDYVSTYFCQYLLNAKLVHSFIWT